MKNLSKNIISKIPLFIFCVLFIAGYSRLFGAKNSTIGITILTTMLIFLKNDLGFNVKQASISIPIMLLLAIISPKIALINPFLGIVVNFISISIILILSSKEISLDNHVPFMLGFVFAQGYDVTGILFTKRVISVIIGGILIGIIYYLKNRKNETNITILDLIKNCAIDKEHTQWHLKLSVGMTVVLFLGDLLNYPHTIWVAFAVLSLTYHTKEIAVKRMKYRLPATIIGSALFFIVFELIVPAQYHQIVVFATGFIMMFITAYFEKTVANSFNALVSAMVTFSSSGAIILRIFSNTIGVLFAFINNKLFDKIFSIQKSKCSDTINPYIEKF